MEGVTVLIVSSGVAASLSNLTIQHGNGHRSSGGGIENDGDAQFHRFIEGAGSGLGDQHIADTHKLLNIHGKWNDVQAVAFCDGNAPQSCGEGFVASGAHDEV